MWALARAAVGRPQFLLLDDQVVFLPPRSALSLVIAARRRRVYFALANLS